VPVSDRPGRPANRPVLGSVAYRLLTAGSLIAALAGCAPRPETPRILPELVLDIENPVIDARIGDAMLRLRVDLDRRNTLELNAVAADRLPLKFESGEGVLVGRVAVEERNAGAEVTIGGVTLPLTFSTFDRDCCTGSDGAIGPDLLPYDRVRFVRAGGVPGATERTFDLTRSSEGGLTIATSTPAGEVFVGLSLTYPGALATAAAGAILAEAQGGRLIGDRFDVAPAFGVSRPAQRLILGRAVELAGFPVSELAVRIADFRGSHVLPRDAPLAGEIVVRQRGPRAQRAWPTILIGRDRLDRCAEILFTRDPMSIMLRCAFAGAPR
jgi:hypothetical protein